MPVGWMDDVFRPDNRLRLEKAKTLNREIWNIAVSVKSKI